MRYISTRGEAPVLGFEDVLLAGLARDGGLYVPETWPRMAPDDIARLAGRSFAEITTDVVHRFVGDAFTKAELLAMAEASFATFGHKAVTPLVQLDSSLWVLELFHGPTLAFKDVAMQLLARMLDAVLIRRGERATIVGATSGDTGGAAIEAFRGSANVDVVILYPQGRVSDVQRRMMTTPTESNVHALAVEGTFDDCQALVKAMFNHHAFRDRVRLSGVNSINWGRIVAQTSYYFAAATALGAPHRALSFAVPTGNFGDILAGWVAKRMGLPIDRLVIAANENDILPRTVATGVYQTRGVVETSSPSMDIQISSNFERWLYEASGRDASLIRSQMSSLAQSGRFEVQGGQRRLAEEFSAAAATETDVENVIKGVASGSGYLADPHTACGLHAAALAHANTSPMVVLSTAHPAKFPDAMQRITGSRPALPARLSRLMTDPERFDVLPADQTAIEAYVARISRAVAG